ncbi:diacylglycerol kinase family protein [Caballeronia sp. LZ032]|uniref:diacylglycerol/lipid kinase family protein n=1 Tax=Caballeronia sp. LZ032 TaxID=3038565 RepID=UPI0028590C0E|nr:diacylglycerol kinase family protein [Caballeronia sp. LZ032]MDR5882575.1 diacylglycerol kinase family protein [Caballeronia sp. LZ032]
MTPTVASPSVTSAETAITLAPDAPFFIVMNAGSGRKLVDETRVVLERELGAAGRRFELRVVEDPRRLQAVARETADAARAQDGVLVGAGGDGTLCTVAHAALDAGCPFAVLPRGTFNYFSRDHGIPADLESSTKLLLAARAYPTQTGFANGRMFLVNASLGLYPRLLEDRETYKQQFGRSRLVALWSALYTMLKPHRHLRLHLEHEGRTTELRSSTLFVANNRLQMEQIGMPDAARALEQGLLAALAPRPVGRLMHLWLSLHGAAGRLADSDHVTSLTFERIVVTHPSKKRKLVKIATDGEITRLQLPLEFRVSDRPLLLLKPEPEVAEANRS